MLNFFRNVSASFVGALERTTAKPLTESGFREERSFSTGGVSEIRDCVSSGIISSSGDEASAGDGISTGDVTSTRDSSSSGDGGSAGDGISVGDSSV
ncbi:hypothetical protein F442_12692, partial [Phytophthora nicotianae P10297]